PARSSLFQRVKGNLLITFERFVGANRIRQNQCVLAVLVREIIVNALLFHQTADEVEIRLAILDAIFPGFVAGRKLELIIAETEGGEDILDDRWHGHILENVAIGGARQKPEPGNDGSP